MHKREQEDLILLRIEIHWQEKRGIVQYVNYSLPILPPIRGLILVQVKSCIPAHYAIRVIPGILIF